MLLEERPFFQTSKTQVNEKKPAILGSDFVNGCGPSVHEVHEWSSFFSPMKFDCGRLFQMGVSLNGGTQQPWLFLLKMIILGCFWGTIIFGNTQINLGPSKVLTSVLFHHEELFEAKTIFGLQNWCLFPMPHLHVVKAGFCLGRGSSFLPLMRYVPG